MVILFIYWTMVFNVSSARVVLDVLNIKFYAESELNIKN